MRVLEIVVPWSDASPDWNYLQVLAPTNTNLLAQPMAAGSTTLTLLDYDNRDHPRNS